jgi:hypothetical protein
MPTNELSMYVCETAQKAQRCIESLEELGYPAAQITVEEVVNTIYDAVEYKGGTKRELLPPHRWVVIGRR